MGKAQALTCAREEALRLKGHFRLRKTPFKAGCKNQYERNSHHINELAWSDPMWAMWPGTPLLIRGMGILPSYSDVMKKANTCGCGK